MQEHKFFVGQLVRHTRLNFRGVVYEVDLRGSPDDGDSWRNPATSLAEKEQAWYKLLVHGEKGARQVAESDLQEDNGGEQVVHPRIKEVFESFARGRYKPRVL
jgi:heat shock protein HspQ